MCELNPFMAANGERMKNLLMSLAASHLPSMDTHTIQNTIDDIHLKELHRFIAEHLDNIGKELANRKANIGVANRSMLVLSSPAEDGNTFFGSGGSNQRKTFDILSTLVAQLGPPTGTRKESTLQEDVNEFYTDFMRRYEGRNTDAIKERKIFYEGGVSKVSCKSS